MELMTKKNIQMVDVKSQYLNIKKQIDDAIQETINSTQFINGPKVRSFQEALENYLDVEHVIPCGNGTDALQIALMACGLEKGDEVLVPAFTYVATAEVIALLGLVPIMVDSNPDTFNMDVNHLKKYITEKTKAIVPVHLFGQCADMEIILAFAKRHKLFVIEDNAQAIGASYKFESGKVEKAGTIGHIGTTSFYPSKNLGCYGDGGALFTNDEELAKKIRMIANHGQSKKYHHSIIGVNSRLDSIQAAILEVKLKFLDTYSKSRSKLANYYDEKLGSIDGLITPLRAPFSTHVFHQYTLKVGPTKRDAFKEYLKQLGIPSMVYYPIPLYKQEAFKQYFSEELPVTEALCQQVISLPMHSEMEEETQDYIVDAVQNYFA